MMILKLSRKRIKYLTLFFSLVSTIPLSFQTQAVHMSAFRVYLDENQRQSTFTLSNTETKSQECNLSLGHYNYDDEGILTKHEGNTLPNNSAKDWMRFSPKHFTLTQKNSQKIRFSVRRKAKSVTAEYRSFLIVDCDVKNQEAEVNLINIKPKLIHNVPIIVRIGRTKVDAAFNNITVKDGAVYFALTRNGTRSIYGDIELIDKKSGRKISYQKGLSIYPESSHSNLSLSTNGIEPEDLKLKFIENTQFGGDIVIEQDLML
jgi:hypothetical protein